MANLESLPVTIIGKIKLGTLSVNSNYNNPSSAYDGYNYTYSATLQIVPTYNSDDRISPNPNQYDTNQIVPGMWFGTINGNSYLIESVSTPTSSTEIDVILKDHGLYNLLSDPTISGDNTPLLNYGVIFNLSDDGDPIINSLELNRGGYLPDTNYWVNDLYARFQYRNLTTTYYNNNDTNLVYNTGYNIGQIVYLDSTGTFQLVDTTDSVQVEKSFGIITSVNEPEDGNMTVKPFGEIKGGLTLTGFSIGDILYYDATASSTSYVTNVKPATNPLPIYIKISDTTGSLIGGQTSGGASGTSGSAGTAGSSGSSGSSGSDGTSGTSGVDGVSGTSGTSGSSGIDGTSGTSGVDGVSGTSGTSGSSGISGVDGTDGSSGTSGVDGVSGTSGTSGSSGISGVDGTDGSSGTSGVDGVSGTSGTSGSSGSDGTSGTSGSDGTSGTSGVDGVSGTSGTSGSSGSSGDSLFSEVSPGVWTTTNDVLITGSLNVDGTINARELHVTYETSSIIYTSGSTKFGNTIDDTHQFTGSLFISGSINITSGSLVIDGVSYSAMTSGTSGSSGSDGSSGTSGVDGVSGTSGTSGTSGSDGTSGSSGSDGTSGSSGSDGTSGTSGSDGTSGTSGVDGVSGTSGTSGTSGSDGSSGTSGVDGVSGTSGTSGSSGISGVDGTDGSSGTSGVDGVSGTSGTSGSSGSDGTSGTSGVDGVSGTSGTSGSSGSNGSDGTSGSSGTSGSDGTSGSSGISGVDGTDGSSGTSGVDGVSGTSGTSGSSGSSGDSLFAQTGSFWATTNDIQITGSLTVGQGTDVVNSYLFLTDSSSLILTSGSNIIIENGGYITAAFFGDGAGLYNIPASGVTGLQLNQITSGSNTASIDLNGLHINTNTSITGSLNVDGIITARELHIDYVTSSVMYTSGSTKFGDTIDDTHEFTGSLFISGSVNITSGSLVIDGVPFSAMTSGTSGTSGVDGVSGTSGTSGTSGSDGTSGSSGSDGTSGSSGISGVDGTDGSSGTSGVDGVSGTSGTSGSSGSSGSDGTSGTSGVDGVSGTSGTSGSSGSNGSDGTSGSSGTSGSDGTSGSSGISGVDGTDGSSGTSGVDGVSGTSGTSGTSGSSGSDGSSGTSGDSLFAQTGSMWATTNDVEITGSLKIKGALTAEEYNVTLISSSVLYSSGSTKFGDSFDDKHSFTGSVDITGSITLNGQPVGVGKLDETWFNTYVSSSISQFAGTSSYAIYAENAVIVSGANKQLYVSTPSTTWSFHHNLHERYPVINVFDSNGYIVVPETIRSVNQDTIEVYFNTPETGHIVASVGGAGTSGTSGTSGSSGSDGTSGTSGSDGTSGTSGSDGTSGTSGSSGSDGTSGTSGSSGSDGTSGTSGSDGTSGTSGSSGSDGTSGSSGTSGSDGSSGTSGSSGISGVDGTDGSSGTSGVDGVSGTSGTSGSSGSSGSDGTSGTSGTSGSDGTSGTSGTSGTAGSSGTSGIVAGEIYYFNQSVSSGINTYRDLSIYPTAASQTGITLNVAGQTTGTTVSTFITPELGFSVIPGGTQRFHLHFLKQASNDSLYAQVSIRLTNSSGTPIGPEIISNPSYIGWNDHITSVEVTTDLVLPTTTIDPTNRMLVKVMVDNQDSNLHTVTWYTEGNQAYSFVMTSVGTRSGSSGTSGTSGTSGDSLFAQTGSMWATTNDVEITGSLKIKGTLTAEEYNVTLVSSSVLYQSGSTKFGDTADDTHQITGSLFTTGSVVINGDLTVHGTTTLTATDPLRESLIISGAMAMMQAQIQAQIVSASISMGGQVVMSQQQNVNVMDLGGF